MTEMHQLATWFRGIRTTLDEAWSPSLYAREDLATHLGQVDGFPVQTDDNLPAGVLALKVAGTEWVEAAGRKVPFFREFGRSEGLVPTPHHRVT